jgi:hypothetical protein
MPTDKKQDNILFGAPYDEERYNKGTLLSAAGLFGYLIPYQSSTSVVWSVTSACSMLEIRQKSEKRV